MRESVSVTGELSGFRDGEIFSAEWRGLLQGCWEIFLDREHKGRELSSCRGFLAVEGEKQSKLQEGPGALEVVLV